MEKDSERRAYVDKCLKETEERLAQLRVMKDDEEYFRKRSQERVDFRSKQMHEMKGMSFMTNSLWGMYSSTVDAQQFKSMTLPIFSTTTGSSYDSLVDGALLLSYETVNDPNKVYSRIDNTTTDHLAAKIAVMEGRTIPEMTQAVMTASGMSAIFCATMMFLEAGDHFVSSNRCYGGTEQLFGVTYPKMGWTVDWVLNPWNYDEWEKAITPKTKFLFVESPSNPTLYVADLERLAKMAHAHNIPLIVDNTCASPALQRPFEHGADVVVHSVSKCMCSSGRAIAGVVVAKHKIVTNMPELEDQFARKLQGGHFRNMGPCLHAPTAGSIWDNLNTLEIRMKAVSHNALTIAKWLEKHPKIEEVRYPGLESHPQHDLASRLMRFEDGTTGYGFLMCFLIKGGLEKTKRFANLLEFGHHVTDLGRDYTAWVHNASTTHGQATPESRAAAGIPDNLIRWSAGLESADDAIRSLSKALDQL